MQTPSPTRPDGLWLDDLEEGFEFSSPEYELTEDAILRYAREFDPQPFHLDDAAAEATFFGELVASGWHTASITMRLFVDSGLRLATGVIGAGGSIAWPTAAKAGDVLHLEGRIQTITRSTSRPNRATLLVTHETLNQDHEARQRSEFRLLAWARPDDLVSGADESEAADLRERRK